MMRTKLSAVLVVLLFLFGALMMFFSPVSAADEYKFSVNVQINDDLGSRNQNTPKITVTSSGIIGVVWTDARNDTNGDIYFTRSTDGGNIFGDGVANSDVRVAIKTLYLWALEAQVPLQQHFEKARRDILVDVIKDLNDKNLLILKAAIG